MDSACADSKDGVYRDMPMICPFELESAPRLLGVQRRAQ